MPASRFLTRSFATRWTGLVAAAPRSHKTPSRCPETRKPRRLPGCSLVELSLVRNDPGALAPFEDRFPSSLRNLCQIDVSEQAPPSRNADIPVGGHHSLLVKA